METIFKVYFGNDKSDRQKIIGLKNGGRKAYALMVRWVLLKMTQADLQMLRHGDLSFEDIELLKLSCSN